MVFNNLRIDIRGYLGLECACLYDRDHVCNFESRTDGGTRQSIPFSGSGKTTADPCNALGLLRVFSVFAYLVRKPSGRDQLVPAAYKGSMGSYSFGGHYFSLCVPLPDAFVAPDKARSSQIGIDSGNSPAYATRRRLLDD